MAVDTWVCNGDKDDDDGGTIKEATKNKDS